MTFRQTPTYAPKAPEDNSTPKCLDNPLPMLAALEDKDFEAFALDVQIWFEGEPERHRKTCAPRLLRGLGGAPRRLARENVTDMNPLKMADFGGCKHILDLLITENVDKPSTDKRAEARSTHGALGQATKEDYLDCQSKTTHRGMQKYASPTCSKRTN